ncbi:N-acyl-L-amino-acid amidohydrolase [Trinorchestia longiramus]|nr:N-acyl-L-amino-acid amidohydrolase [Trinorchestia longiramus]
MAAIEDPAVTRFREYVRIKTVQPEPDYESCTAWLRARGEAVGGEVRIVESAPQRPVVIITFKGTNPQLPTLLLNSHTDVVPVFPEHWKYDPFSAHKDEEGNIYGRGTQDMKCVGMQYLEAIDRMRKQGKTFMRTIHLSFVPDEEIGGFLGMKEFVKMPEFRDLNVGFALDEGYANPTENFSLFYGERTVWWVLVKCAGQPGHGSQFLTNTAGEKLQKVVNNFLNFRTEQQQKLEQNPDLQLGDVNSCNLTMLKGGVQFNVVPAELCVGFDLRLTPTLDLPEFEQRIAGWCRDAGEGVTFEFKQKMMNQELTVVEDGKCSWWDAFNGACKQEGLTLVKTIFPAATDCRFIREVRT